MNLTPIELRHRMHSNPELAFQEFETTQLIIDNIRLLSESDKIKIHTPFPTGVLFEYKVNDVPFILFKIIQ